MKKFIESLLLILLIILCILQTNDKIELRKLRLDIESINYKVKLLKGKL
jgi:hypothetical protein